MERQNRKTTPGEVIDKRNINEFIYPVKGAHICRSRGPASGQWGPHHEVKGAHIRSRGPHPVKRVHIRRSKGPVSGQWGPHQDVKVTCIRKSREPAGHCVRQILMTNK